MLSNSKGDLLAEGGEEGKERGWCSLSQICNSFLLQSRGEIEQ